VDFTFVLQQQPSASGCCAMTIFPSLQILLTGIAAEIFDDAVSPGAEACNQAVSA